MPGGAAKWARKRAGKDDAASVQSASAASSQSSGASSVSAASDEGFKDDKFHLPVDHRPFVLLPGWDQPPAPPPEPGGSSSGSSSGSDSGSESGSESAESESKSDSGDEGSGNDDAGPPGAGADGQQQLAPPPPTGFSCATCMHFKAHGNGMYGCDNEDFQRWSGTDKLVETKSGKPVLNPQLSCSDWYEPAAHHGGVPVPTRHNGRGGDSDDGGSEASGSPAGPPARKA
jgi:hypothetical protein